MKICANGISRASAKVSTGSQSLLFSELVEHFNSRDTAMELYISMNTSKFKNTVYDWEKDKRNHNEQGEPKLSILIKRIEDYHKRKLEDEQFEISATTSETNTNAETSSDTDVQNEFETLGREEHIDANIDKERIQRYNIARLVRFIKVKYKQLDGLNTSISALQNVTEPEKLDERRKLITKRNKLLAEINELKGNRNAEVRFILDNGIEDLKDIERYIMANKDNLSFKELIYFRDKLNMWSNARKIFLFGMERSIKDYDRSNGEDIGFDELEGSANRIRRLLYDTSINLYSEYVKDKTNTKYNYDVKSEFEMYKDISALFANVQHIGRSGLKAFGVLEKIHLMGIMKLSKKLKIQEAEIDELVKGVKNVELLREKYNDGILTGNITSRFTPEFNIAYEEMIAENRTNLVGRDNKNGILAWTFNNTIMFDPRLFFADFKHNGKAIYDGGVHELAVTLIPSTGNLENSKNELMDILGADAYNTMYKRAKDAIQKYAIDREYFLEDIEMRRSNNLITDDEYNHLRTKWELQNSPYVYAYNVTNASPITYNKLSYYSNAKDSVIAVPRKYKVDIEGNTTNILTGWYNEDFAKIEADPKLKALHDYITELNYNLRLVLPYHIANNIQDNFLLQVKKTVVDSVLENRDTIGSNIHDTMLGLIAKYESDESSQINEFTGEKDYKLNISSIEGYNAALAKLIEHKTIQFQVEHNGELPSPKETVAIRREAKGELAAGNSFNLRDLLLLWNYQVEMFSHKAQIEDVVRTARDVISEIQETVDSSTDDHNLRYRRKENSFENAKAQLEYWFDSFYGYDKQRSNKLKKVKTTEDKRLDEELNKAMSDATKQYANKEIDTETYEYLMERIAKARNRLGHHITFEQIGRTILTYTQFKGMAFNFIAAGSNIMFGYMSNLIEASDGRLFNKKEIAKAYIDMTGSVISFNTFGALTTPFARKIRNIVGMYDLVSESSRELTSNKSLKKKNLITDTYRFQNRSEYINQAPIVIAMLRRHMVDVIIDGRQAKMPFLELLDNDGRVRKDVEIINADGYLDTDTETGEEITKLMSKVAKTITIVHGNYNQHMYLKINENVWKASLKQFRTWMFEAFSQRMERLKYDDVLELTRKGRYRTGIGFISFTQFDSRKVDNAEGYIQPTLYVLGQTVRRLLFLNTNLDTKFSEVDAANFRKNIAELRMLLNLMMFLILIGRAMDDDKDKDKRIKEFVFNYMFNTTKRLIDDIKIYTSPFALEKILRNAVPFFATIADITNLFGAVIHLLNGDDEIQGGIYDGKSRMLRAIGKLLPPFNKVQSLEAMSSQTYDDPNAVLDKIAKGK